MDPNVVEAISSVSTEAIKILGPAIITGLVGLKIGKHQLELKLKEIEKNNSFKAREHLFKYYKDWQETIKGKYDELTTALGTITGMAAAVKGHEETGITPVMYKFFNYYVKSVPHDVNLTIRDFEPYKEHYNLEYELLEHYKIKVGALSATEDVSELIESVTDLLEIYGHLNRCAHLLVEKQAKLALQPYLEEKET